MATRSLDDTGAESAFRRTLSVSAAPAQVPENRVEDREHGAAHAVLVHPGGFPSGQRGQTVNLMAQPSQVRILLSPPTSDPPQQMAFQLTVPRRAASLRAG